MNPSPLSALEVSSCDLVAPVRARLTAYCASAAAHARFLNMLSLMEHIGSRKIMLSHGRAEPAQDRLRHLAEETRHAYFFKRLAEKLARRPLGFTEADTIAPAHARAYMGRLDASITQSVSAAPSELPYLYMSLLIELRAIWLYRLYQDVLEEQKAGISLKTVL